MNKNSKIKVGNIIRDQGDGRTILITSIDKKENKFFGYTIVDPYRRKEFIQYFSGIYSWELETILLLNDIKE